MMSNFGSSWWVDLMWAAMVLFLALVVWAVLRLVGGGAPQVQEGHDSGSLRQILDQRLARGEIKDDEYSRLRHLVVDDPTFVGSAGGR